LNSVFACDTTTMNIIRDMTSQITK
jgi:hypothetical protein